MVDMTAAMMVATKVVRKADEKVAWMVALTDSLKVVQRDS